MEVIRSTLVKNKNPNKTLSGNGSACRSGNANVSWFIGQLKTKKGEYVFATSMESGPEIPANRAEMVTMSILQK